MRGLFLSLSHFSLILLVSLLLLSTNLLWAQTESPSEKIQVQLPDAPSQPRLADRGLPLSFEQNQGRTESSMKFFLLHTDDYRVPINTEALLDPATRAPELWGKEKYFISSTPSEGLTLAPGKVHHEPMYAIGDLERYGHHIPWAGSLILRICQQAKAHPHVIRAVKVLHPQF